MRIVENSPTRLRLRDRTLWISGVCFAAAIAIAAGVVVKHAPLTALTPAALFLLFGLAFLQATDAVLDRERGTCRIWRLRALKTSTRELKFADITDIRVDTRLSTGANPVIMCRLVLVTAAEVIPLTASY